MEDLFARQRARYLSGATRPVRARLDALAKLHEVLKRHEGELLRALAEDLGKSPEEAYMTEMGVVYDELRFARRRLRAWSLPRFALPSGSTLLCCGILLCLFLFLQGHILPMWLPKLCEKLLSLS